MSPTKVAEIRQDHRGDRRACPLCNPPDPRRHIRADELWVRVYERGGRGGPK